MKLPTEIALGALRQSVENDNERIKEAFSNLSESELDKEYGQSGKTCRQILDRYRQERQGRVGNDLLRVMIDSRLKKDGAE